MFEQYIVPAQRWIAEYAPYPLLAALGIMLGCAAVIVILGLQDLWWAIQKFVLEKEIERRPRLSLYAAAVVIPMWIHLVLIVLHIYPYGFFYR